MALKTIEIGERYLSIKINTEIARMIIGNFQKTVTEARFKVEDGWLTGVGMDGSHIGLSSFKIYLDELSLNESGKTRADQCGEVGVNFKDLSKILTKAIRIIKSKRNKKNNSIIKNGLNEEIELIFGKKGIIVKTGKMQIHLDATDIENEEINLDSLNNMEFVVKTTINIGELRDILMASYIFAEAIQMKYIANEKVVNFSTEGDMGDMEYEVKEGIEIVDKQYKGFDNIFNTYAAMLLDNMLKFFPRKDNIELYLKTEAPLKIVYKLCEKSEIMSFLAPRVEKEKEQEEE